MSVAQEQLKASRDYKASHPEVDWNFHVVELGRDPQGNWVALGHREWTAQDERLAAPCCGGTCPSHAGRRPGVPRPRTGSASPESK